MNGIQTRLILPALLLASLALAAPAQAVDRFATPGGPASGTCLTEGTACDLEFAIENAAVGGDKVNVLPGTYTETDTIFETIAVEISGVQGQPLPTLNSTFAGSAIGIDDANAAIRRMRIVSSPGASPQDAVVVGDEGGTLEQVIASTASTSASASACGTSSLDGNFLIRDSLCFATNGGDGLDLNLDGTTSVSTLRNVTAIGFAGQTALGSNAGSGDTATINATNVIAHAPSGADIFAQGAGTTTFTLDHSNYSNETHSGGASVTPIGTGTNQTAAPVFVNAGGGDFHQTAASPTRNAGVGGAGLGSLDIDGEARTLGTAPDIGADEFTESPPAPPDTDGDGVPDASDACPAVAGPASNNGCPVPVDTGGAGGGGGGGSGDGGGSGGDGGGGGGGATPDIDDPETEITKSPKKDLKAGDTAKVSFESDEDGATFECKVGKKGKFKACTSPLRIRDLEKGKTKVQIRAVDSAGNVDETPAKLTIEATNGKDNR